MGDDEGEMRRDDGEMPFSTSTDTLAIRTQTTQLTLAFLVQTLTSSVDQRTVLFMSGIF